MRLTGADFGRVYLIGRCTPETGSISVPIGDSLSDRIAAKRLRWKYPYIDACAESDIVAAARVTSIEVAASPRRAWCMGRRPLTDVPFDSLRCTAVGS